MKLNIKKGDSVQVIAGNSKGQSGRVLLVNRERMLITVEGVNMRSKAQRPSQQHPNGGIIKIEAPVHYSNVMLVDKKGEPTRVRFERTEVNGKKTVRRIAKTTDEEI